MLSVVKKRLCYVVPHYGTLDAGTSLRSVAVARRLADSFETVDVITPDSQERTLEKMDDLPGEDGKVALHYMKGFTNYRRNFWTRIAHEMRLAIGLFIKLWKLRPDTIVTSYPPAFTPVPSILVGRLFGSKVILEVRDLMAGALAASSYSPNSLASRLARWYEKLLFRAVDGIAIVSPGMAREIHAVAPSKPILRAYNGIEDSMLDFGRISNQKPSDRLVKFWKQTQFLPDQKYVVYAGAMTQSYDLGTIIDGFTKAKLDGFSLLLLGNGERRIDFEAYVARRGFTNIVFHDFVNRETALEIIKNARVAVHAFNSDAHWAYVLGNKVFDYIAMGTPVLYSGVGTTADLVRSTEAGLVSTPGDSECFSMQLAKLCNDPESHFSRSKAQEVVARDWSRSKLTDQFILELVDFLGRNS